MNWIVSLRKARALWRRMGLPIKPDLECIRYMARKTKRGGFQENVHK